MDRDKNLLFGIFAVQLNKISPTQLIEAAAAWAANRDKDLPSRLVELGALTESDRALVQQLIDAAVEAHGGDAHKTLNTFGGERQVAATYQGSIVVTSSGDVAAQSTRYAGETVLGAPQTPSIRGVQEAPDRYTHVSEYGRGGMGRVLLVEDSFLGRSVALKELMPNAPGANPDAPSPVRQSAPMVARFLQEAKITGQLEHPSIVPVYELGYRQDGTLYYTMKLVRGKTLKQAIDECGTLEERLKLLPHFVDLCQAIAYAHSRGVIHRDIKPQNVMVGEFGETVVLDWGLAKVKGAEDVHERDLEETFRVLQLGDEEAYGQTVYGHAIGTPAYMPPEQAKGQLDQIDERSDVYSLGAVLYELLTGQAPVQGSTMRELLDSAIHGVRKDLAEVAPDAPPELGAVALHAMSVDPNRRYGNVTDFAADIQRFQSGSLVAAYAYSMGDHTRRFLRQNARPIALGSAILVVFICGLLVYTVSLSRLNASLRDARDKELALRIEADKQRAIAEDKEAEADQSAEQALQARDAAVLARERLEDIIDQSLRDNLFLERERISGFAETPCDALRFHPILIPLAVYNYSTDIGFAHETSRLLVQDGRFSVLDRLSLSQIDWNRFHLGRRGMDDNLSNRLSVSTPNNVIRPALFTFVVNECAETGAITLDVWNIFDEAPLLSIATGLLDHKRMSRSTEEELSARLNSLFPRGRGKVTRLDRQKAWAEFESEERGQCNLVVFWYELDNALVDAQSREEILPASVEPAAIGRIVRTEDSEFEIAVLCAYAPDKLSEGMVVTLLGTQPDHDQAAH